VVYKAFRQRQRRSDLFPLDQLDGISQSQEVRLRDFGIDDAQNLASTEIPLLLINTPFPVQTVVDWVDQAVLMVLLNDVNALDNFRKAHVRTMTDFRDLWEPHAEKYRRLKHARELAESEPTTTAVAAIDAKLTALRDEQTDIANALNSNIALLNALFSSTNFDMNVHYLNNYRKNVELLLPGWASARYNRYLVEAYKVRSDDPPVERKELNRLWNFVNAYLQTNQQIEQEQKQDIDDGRHGMTVNPNSVEARLGLARLYTHQAHHAADEDNDYEKLAEVEYKEAIKQILLAVTQIASASHTASQVPNWTPVQQAAARAVHSHVAQSIMPHDQKSPALPDGGSEIAPVLIQPARNEEVNGNQEPVPVPENN
jgi:hypothetical protein